MSRRWRGVVVESATAQHAIAAMHRGQFEGTAGPRRRRATSVGFRVEPQAVGRARQRVRETAAPVCAVTANLGTWAPAFKRHGSGAGDESCEGRDAHLHCNCTLCSQCSFSPHRARSFERVRQRRLHYSVDCWRLANDGCAFRLSAAAFCSLLSKVQGRSLSVQSSVLRAPLTCTQRHVEEIS